MHRRGSSICVIATPFVSSMSADSVVVHADAADSGRGLPRPLLHANEVSISTRTIVQGGALSRSGWMPREISSCDGVQFVALFKNEYSLDYLLRDSERANSPIDAGFLEHMRTLRNRAVDDALFDYFRERDPMCAKLPSNARNKVSAAELPDAVEVKFPALQYRNVVTPAQSIAVRLDLAPHSVVRVELSEASLACVRAAALSYMESALHRETKRTRRSGAGRCSTGYDFIHADYRRKQLWVKHITSDGWEKRHSVPCDPIDDESCKDTAIAELWEFLRHNHYVKVDGVFVLASDPPGLDMFEDDAGEAGSFHGDDDMRASERPAHGVQ